MDAVVIGAGSWGTALAFVLGQNQHRVTLWGRDADQLADIESTRQNRRYLPGLTLPAGLRCEPNLHAALAALPASVPSLVVSVVPSHTTRQLLTEIAPLLPPFCLTVTASKGIENETLCTMIEVLRSNYVRTARAKGLPERLVITRHAMRAAILPLVSYLGPATAGIVTGSLVVEQIFNLPGIGKYFINGALQRDYTLVMGVVILYASLVILLNLVADVLYGLLDPKIRYE